MKIQKITIIYILLFIFCINLFNLEGRWLVLSFVCLLFLKERKGKFVVTKNSLLLAIFSCIFYLLSVIYHPSLTTFYILPYLVGPFLGYTVGLEIMNMSNSQTLDSNFKKLIYVIVFGRFFHGLLNYLVSGGYVGGRNGIDFWTHSMIAATGQGALMTLSISLLFYAVFILSKRLLLEKIFVLGSVYLSVLNSIQSASRTALIVMLITFVSCILYTLYVSEVSKQRKMTVFLGVCGLVLLGIMAFQQNWLEVQSRWTLSPLYARLHNYQDWESGDSGRYEMLSSALKSGFSQPFGDGSFDNAHNLWLDTLKQTGWFPFLFLILFTFSVLKDSWLFLRNRKADTPLKYLFLSVMIAFILNFSVEPTMQGFPYYFASFCIMSGALERYLKLLKQEETLL